MSGVKVDLDGARDRGNITKAKFVIEDVDIDSLFNDAKENKPDNNDSPRITDVEEETFDAAMKNPSPPRSETKIVVSDRKSGIKAPEPKSSTKSVAESIKSAFRSAAKSARQSPSRLVDVPAAKSSTIHIIDPVDSTQHKMEQEQEAVERDDEEFDMQPQTDQEKLLYWRTRLQILKKNYKNVHVPKAKDVTWRECRRMYYLEVDKCSIDKNVGHFKLIMIVLFFIVEWISVKFFKLNMTGFTVHSIKSMHRYDRLLIEMSEKSYSSIGDNWPVEVRLGILVLVNAIIFGIAKAVFKFTGEDHSEQFFELYSSLGVASIEDDILPDGVGLDAPNPNQGGGGGLGSLLSGVLGGLSGNGTGGGLGGLASLFSGFGANKDIGTAPDGDKKGTPKADGDDESRIKPPAYRRRKRKPKKAEAEE